MKFTAALVALTMSAGAAQAGSIQSYKDGDTTFPSVVRIGGAAAPVKTEAKEAKADTGLPDMPTVDAEGNPLDGRSQLEAWAKMHNTTVEDVLMKRLYGHYPKHTDGKIAALEKPEPKAAKAEPMGTDNEKTASVTPDENAPSAPPAPVAADAGGQPMFPQGELRKPE